MARILEKILQGFVIGYCGNEEHHEDWRGFIVEKRLMRWANFSNMY
jgi:hypothetical protein